MWKQWRCGCFDAATRHKGTKGHTQLRIHTSGFAHFHSPARNQPHNPPTPHPHTPRTARTPQSNASSNKRQGHAAAARHTRTLTFMAARTALRRAGPLYVAVTRQPPRSFVDCLQDVPVPIDYSKALREHGEYVQ